MRTSDFTITLEHFECPTCGVHYGLTSRFVSEHRNTHADWRCPNGHTLHFPAESELERERRWRKAAEAAEEQRRRDLNRERRRSAAARGQVTKLRNKIARGECPCCNGKFKNVRRHMTRMHPEFVEAVDA